MRAPSPSTIAPGEWTVATLLGANVIWTTLCLGGYRPETMVVSWLLTGIALALHLVLAAAEARRPHPAGWWLLPFLAYAALNVAVISPVSWLGWRDWLGWLQMIAVFWIALNALRRPGPRGLLLAIVLAMAAVSVLLATYQRFISPDWMAMGRTQVPQFIGRASGPFGIPNSLAALLLLAIPPMLALAWQRGAAAVQRVFFGYLALVFLLGLGLTISRGAWLSLVLALIGWPLCARGQSWAVRITLSVTALATALLAGIVVYSTVPRIQNRLDALARDMGERSRPILWRGAWELFKEAPAFGTGAGSYNVLFNRHRPEGFPDEPQWAHNDYLNTLSDYGAVGFVLFFGAAGALAVRALGRRRETNPSLSAESTVGWASPDVTSAIGVGLGAFALSLMVDFHFKIPALAMVAALAFAEFIRRCWPAYEAHGAGRILRVMFLAGSAAVLLFTLGGPVQTYRAEAIRYAGRQRIDRLAYKADPSTKEQRDVLTDAANAFVRATSIDPDNAQAWADRAYATALWARLAPSRANQLGREAEQAAQLALAHSDVVPEFWIRLGVAFDMQGRWAEAGGAFVRALELAPSSSVSWYHHAYHLSLNSIAAPLALSSIETCLRLDPSNRSALALRDRLESSPPAAVH